jgi:hypothetical protein
MTLEEFTFDWLANGPIQPPMSAYECVAGNTGLTLYRDNRFQVQLWAFPPGAMVSDHAHPNLDSWLVRVSGKFKLTLNGTWLMPKDARRTAWRELNTWCTRVAPGDFHGVQVGVTGGSFLSITERLDGLPPESVHKIWAGPALDNRHAAELAEKV